MSTGFDPAIDALPISNQPAEGFTNGICEGLASYAYWYFMNRASSEGSLRGRFGTLESLDIAVEAHKATRTPDICLTVNENQVVRDIIGGLASGPVPVVVVKGARTSHAVLAYAWDSNKDEIYCYDPDMTPGLPQKGIIRFKEKVSMLGTYIDWEFVSRDGKTIYARICPGDLPNTDNFEAIHARWADAVSVELEIEGIIGSDTAQHGSQLAVQFSAMKAGHDISAAITAYIARVGHDEMIEVYASSAGWDEPYIELWQTDSWESQLLYDIPEDLPDGRYYIRALLKDGASLIQDVALSRLKVYAQSNRDGNLWQYAFRIGPPEMGMWESIEDISGSKTYSGCPSFSEDTPAYEASAWNFEAAPVLLTIDFSRLEAGRIAGTAWLRDNDPGIADDVPFTFKIEGTWVEGILHIDGALDLVAMGEDVNDIDFESYFSGELVHDSSADSLAGSLQFGWHSGFEDPTCGYVTYTTDGWGTFTFSRAPLPGIAEPAPAQSD